MTFTLLRAGLPNSIIAAALAVTPIVALALSPTPHTPHAAVQSEMIVAADGQPAPSGNHAVSD